MMTYFAIGCYNKCSIMGWATLFEYTDEVVEEITLDLPEKPHALLNMRFWRRKKPYDQVLYAQANREVLDSVRAI